MSRVLVVYATRYGSTEQVARAVAAEMEAAGAQVGLAPARRFDGSLLGWDLVVLGAPR